MAGQVYLMPTTDLTYTPTNGFVNTSTLTQEQQYAANYLMENGFVSNTSYDTGSTEMIPTHYMAKTGSVVYRAYYLEGSAVNYLYLYATRYWLYSGAVIPSGTQTILTNTNEWRDNNVGIIQTSNPSIPVGNMLVDYYDNYQDAYNAISQYLVTGYPITYRLTNATTTGPSEANVGDTVTVPLTFPDGYGVVNPSSDAYVTCNGVLVPSTYSNGQLVFTMPDPNVS